MNLDRDQKRSAIYQSIYNNPERIFNGYDFKPDGNGKAARRHDTRNEGFRITYARDGAVVLHNNGDHSGLLIAAHENAVKVWQRLNNLPSFDYALRDLADIYGVNYSFDEKTERCFINAKVHKQLLPTIWPIFVNELTSNPTGEVAAYLDKRMLRHDGAFAKRYGALTPQSIAKAKAAARSATDENGKTLTPQQIEDAFKDLHFDDYHCTTLGYKLIIALNQNGKFDSITLRPIDANFKGGNKYLQPANRNKFAAYEAIDTTSKTAYLIEGYLDKATLEQSECKNVFAYGGQGFNENLLAMLKNYGFTQAIYIPDIEAKKTATRKQIEDAQAQGVKLDFIEYNPDTGEPYKRREIIDGCIKTMLNYNNAAADRGEQRLDFKIFDLQHYLNRKFGEVLAAKIKDINDLYVYEHRQATPDDLPDLPLDCNTLNAEAKDIAVWELIECDTNATASKTAAEILDEVVKITEHTRPTDWRSALTTIDTKNLENLKAKGITPELIADEKAFKERRQTEAKKDKLLADITHARKQGDTDKEGQLLRQYAELMRPKSQQDDIKDQFNRKLSERLARMKNRPEPLKTKFRLGWLKNNKLSIKQGIDLYPASIAVICAPTANGKTSILFTIAADIVRDNPDKVVLYASCEENELQLTEKYINLYFGCKNEYLLTAGDDIKSEVEAFTADIETKANADHPLNDNNETGFDKPYLIKGEKRRTIKALCEQRQDLPKYYDLNNKPHGQLYKADTFKQLNERFNNAINGELGDILDNRFLFAYTGNKSTSEICEKIKSQVEDIKSKGGEVAAIFVDYFQLLTEGEGQMRNYELKDICTQLQDFAAATNLPIVIASQFNREVITGRDSKGGFDVMSKANIAEASDIEKIAHDIWACVKIDTIKLTPYIDGASGADQGDQRPKISTNKIRNSGERSVRIFEAARADARTAENALKTGSNGETLLYIENLKAREGIEGVWGLFSTDYESGYIGDLERAKCSLNLATPAEKPATTKK